MSKLSIVLKNSAAFRGFFFECKPLPPSCGCLAMLLSFEVAAPPDRFVLITFAEPVFGQVFPGLPERG